MQQLGDMGGSWLECRAGHVWNRYATQVYHATVVSLPLQHVGLSKAQHELQPMQQRAYMGGSWQGWTLELLWVLSSAKELPYAGACLPLHT